MLLKYNTLKFLSSLSQFNKHTNRQGKLNNFKNNVEIKFGI